MLLPLSFEAMEHGGAFTTRAGVLDVDTAKWILFDFRTEMYLVGKGGVGRLGSLGGDISSQHTFFRAYLAAVNVDTCLTEYHTRSMTIV